MSAFVHVNEIRIADSALALIIAADENFPAARVTRDIDLGFFKKADLFPENIDLAAFFTRITARSIQSSINAHNTRIAAIEDNLPVFFTDRLGFYNTRMIDNVVKRLFSTTRLDDDHASFNGPVILPNITDFFTVLVINLGRDRIIHFHRDHTVLGQGKGHLLGTRGNSDHPAPG